MMKGYLESLGGYAFNLVLPCLVTEKIEDHQSNDDRVCGKFGGLCVQFGFALFGY